MHNAVSYRQLKKQPAVPVGSLLRNLDGLPQHRLGRVHQVLKNKPLGLRDRPKQNKQPLHDSSLPFMLYIQLKVSQSLLFDWMLLPADSRTPIEYLLLQT